MLNEYRVSVWEDEKFCGEPWQWLHSDVNVHNAIALHTWLR